jgi:PAS domain S-box-containing protein
MRMLSKLHQRQPLADSLESLWKVVLEALEEVDPRDVQFALLYSVHAREGDDTEIPTCPGGRVTPERLALEGVIGLDQSSPDAAMFFERMPLEVCKEPHSAELRLLQMDQNSNLWRAVQTMAKSEQPVEKMMLCPIFAHDTTITGFLLLGTDSQAYNDDLRMFAHTLADSMSKSVSIVLLLKKLRDAQLTSAALLRRVEEAERSTFMFRHMAESATVGCAIFDPSGHPMWLNEAYLNLTGNSREDFRPGTWQKAILPEDLPEVEGRWNQLASGQPIVPFTFRVKQHPSATAKPGSCESLDYRWLLSNAYVDFDEDGSCRRVMGWLTDISAQKWNESLQTQRLADALETKRQTERFIDMVRLLLPFQDSLNVGSIGFS